MDIIKLAKKYGKENLMFLVPMHPLEVYFGLIAIKSSDSPEFIVPCEINEDRHKLDAEYKITLQAIGDYLKSFCKEHYYISDLEQLIESGHIKFYIKGDAI